MSSQPTLRAAGSHVLFNAPITFLLILEFALLTESRNVTSCQQLNMNISNSTLSFLCVCYTEAIYRISVYLYIVGILQACF